MHFKLTRFKFKQLFSLGSHITLSPYITMLHFFFLYFNTTIIYIANSILDDVLKI